MSFRHRLTVASCIVAVSALPLFAQEETTAATPLAVVNGKVITLGHLIQQKEALDPQYQQLPNAMLMEGLLEQSIRHVLLSDALEGEGPLGIRYALENSEREMRAAEVAEQVSADVADDAAIAAEYQRRFVDVPAQKEYHAAHILVKTEDEAKALIAELEGGADFAELAKTHSTGPSGPDGGNLGWFGTGRMVKPFEDAVVAMEAGAISGPVQTDFGWHVINLIETRDVTPPTLDEVRRDIIISLRSKAVEDYLETLMGAAEIDRSGAKGIDPALLSKTELLD